MRFASGIGLPMKFDFLACAVSLAKSLLPPTLPTIQGLSQLFCQSGDRRKWLFAKDFRLDRQASDAWLSGLGACLRNTPAQHPE